MTDHLPGLSIGSISSAIKKQINPNHHTPNKRQWETHLIVKEVPWKEELRVLRIRMFYKIHQSTTKQEMEMI